MTGDLNIATNEPAAPTLYIIDGFAQIFRAFHAIRNGMRSPITGEPTHAVFGFTAMLLKLLGTYKAEYAVVAFDAPGPTFRDELYSDYKATRSETPPDLIEQIPRVLAVTEALGLNVIQQSGLEADDVMACIVHWLRQNPDTAHFQVRMISKDKDLGQLIDSQVALFDIHTDTVTGPVELLADKGIRPDQVIDYLMLTGDSVDNVPGVDGIGPKTAAELLGLYDTIEGIYANIAKVTGKRKEKLIEAQSHLGLSRQLVTLACDHPLGLSLDQMQVRPPNSAKAIDLFRQLGFNRFQEEIQRLGPAGEPDSPAEPVASLAQKSTAFRVVSTLSGLQDLLAQARQQKIAGFGVVTSRHTRTAAICGFSLAWEGAEPAYIPVRASDSDLCIPEAECLAALKPYLEDWNCQKCGHGVKRDAAVLLNHGIHLRGVTFDTQLAATLLSLTGSLDELSRSMLSEEPRISPAGEGELDQFPVSAQAAWAIQAASTPLGLYPKLAAMLEEQQMTALCREIETPLSSVLAELEHNGILCDPDELRRQGAELGIRVDELRKEIVHAAGLGFDLNSPKQLAEVLFDRLGLAPGRKTKTGRSTDSEVLEKLAEGEDENDPRTSVPRLILEYRQLTKLISTYFANLIESIRPETGRIHSTFHQLATATGRLASHSPNMQNIPIRSDIGKRIRRAFYAPDGWMLVSADYSQIELRVLAHLSHDPALIEAFRLGLDIHTAVASQVFGVSLTEVSRAQRDQAKTINFGIIYGISAFGLSRRIPGLPVDAASTLIRGYRATYAGIDSFLQECISKAQTDGYVSTITGRRRAIPEIRSSNAHSRSLGERLAINSVVQGSAADLIKAAMVHIQHRIDDERLPAKGLLQIHDELVFEAPADQAASCAAMVKHEMEHAITLDVPIMVDTGVGTNWMESKGG